MNLKKWQVHVYGYYHDRKWRFHKKIFPRMRDAVEWADNNGGSLALRKLTRASDIEEAWAYSYDEDYSVPDTPKELFRNIKKPAYIKNLPPGMLEWLVTASKDAYYNTDAAIMDDATYDRIESRLKKQYPRSPMLRTGADPVVGAPSKVNLPYYLGSMDKLRSGVESWGYPGPYLVTEKLDGVSLLYINQKGVSKLYTRGNGMVGQDVSKLAKALRLPRIPDGWAVRGELIMPEAKFRKYASDFANPRNMMSGMVNSKSVSAALKDADFVAFELLNPRRTFSQALKALKARKFNVPWFQVVDTLDSGKLTDSLLSRRGQAKYAVDGLVVYDDNRHEVNESGNPSWAFAFKSIEAATKVKVTVTGVEWNNSRHGQLKPVVLFEPVWLAGVFVGRATAHNAKYIYDNKIAKGARIEVIRAGDVIPYIVRVLKGARKPEMPDQSWEWDATETNILSQELDDSQATRQLLHQFRVLGIEKLGAGKSGALVAAGYSSLDELYYASEDELAAIIGPKLASTYHDTVWGALSSADHVALIMASGLLPMGIAQTKMTSLFKRYPAISTWTPKQQMGKANQPPPDFSVESFREVLAILPAYATWLGDWGIKNKPYKVERVKRKSSDLEGNVYLFTGQRDNDLEQKLIANGATIATSFSRKVTHVVAANVNSTHGKARKAREAGIPIVDIQQLRSRFL